MSFTYDDNSIRTSKTVNGVVHTYQLNGSQIVSESWGDKLLVYLYDASGSPIGMMYSTTSYAEGAFDVFWFDKNLQGDIVAVYNESGTKVATYTYSDAWGDHSVTYSNGGASTGAQYNPFRYRGYYYDTDLGMYYLQSRYYDANICRFINADSALYHSMLGYNMFAYCENNPVNYYDPCGESATAIIQWWTSLLGTISVIEPTLIVETILIIGIVVICGISLGQKAYETIDFVINVTNKPKVTDSITQEVEDAFGETTISEVKTRTKEEADPNRRPNQKKQGREVKSKSRLGNWSDRNNKRHGRAKLPKHTPSKKGHKKYFTTDKPIKIY